ncbi:pyrroline-5-carboxylate reductase [Pseudogulbenkiania sp. MAI-1]|uniref:pyrroline-5-carboxylate reductase n=1 Tax=Pseudogulbenkiania sp. MAI-1 TaxID=990370 RepID=UPI00045E6466|nr:pyrroline-5-carboxylate reductase [Pseudogulbenkiania sp. MAI-1]
MSGSDATTIGFVGTGAITKAIVTGLVDHAGVRGEIWLSPRSAEIVTVLTTRYPNVRVAKDNQDVVDRSRRVFMAVRPQVAQEVLSELSFSEEHIVINLIAGYTCERLERDSAQRPGRVVRAVPFPSIANGNCKTLIFPDDEDVRQMFERVGGTVGLSSEAQLETMVAMGATMELFFRVLHTYADWAEKRGIDYASARTYLASQYAGLVDIAIASQIPFDVLSKQFTTKGGLNEQVTTTFENGGGFGLLQEALDQVERRLLASE